MKLESDKRVVCDGSCDDSGRSRLGGWVLGSPLPVGVDHEERKLTAIPAGEQTARLE